MKKSIIAIFFIIGLIAMNACKKENERNDTKISSNGKSESHNMGQNCMNCHKSGGSGDGWFNIAGTVYDSLKVSTLVNSSVKLYTEPNGAGTLKYTIQVDAKGNFYTTENIDFGTGLYPSASGSNTTKYMGSSITMGQCNSCHGVSTDKIWSK